MKMTNEVVLRPRFKMVLNKSGSELMELFKQAKTNSEGYSLTLVDDHIFIRLPVDKQSFWAPQLHLEFFETSGNGTEIKGFFSPQPAVWTMFMFFHVVVGTLFLADMIWLYSNFSLNIPIGLQIGIGIALVLIWFLLYAGGTIGKKKGKPGMQSLYRFMLRILD